MIYIVGSGVIGLSIAYELISNGYQTEILKADQSGQSSVAAAGMLAPFLEFKPYEKKLLEMMIESNEKWKNFSEKIYKDSKIKSEYQKNSSLLIGNNEDDLRQMEFKLKKLKFLNIEFDQLSREETLNLEPNLSRYVHGSYLIKNQDQINPIRLMSSLEKAFQNHGGKIHDNVFVEKIEIDKQTVNIFTQKKKFSCKKLILATGSWSRSILKDSFNINIPLRPVKGVTLELTEKENNKNYKYNLWFKKIYIAPRINGNLIAGATEEDVGFETEVTLNDMFFLIKNIWEAIPLGENYNFLKFRSGLRPTTFDGYPLIGSLDKVSKNIICAFGHYRNGILLAPETANLVLNLVKNQKKYFDFLSPNRF